MTTCAMVVKQKQSSVRKPSPTLWAMARNLSEDQWAQLKAFSQVYGKGSLQFRLLELLRSMPQYDPLAEREGIDTKDLYSLRRRAKQWLVRTGRRLAFYVKEVEEQSGDIDVLIGWGHHEEAMEWVVNAKQLAKSQDEFLVLARVLEQEKVVVRELYQGDDRTNALLRIANEVDANNQNLLLAADMARNAAMYLEPVKNTLARSGKLDHAAVKMYFETTFHKTDVSALPISLQMEKLSIDEFFYNVAERYEEAAATASRIVRLLKENPGMMEREPDKLPKVLRRLAAFYAELRWEKEALDIIRVLEDLSSHSDKNRDHYLLTYLHLLFGAAIDWSMSDLAAKGLKLLETNIEHILSLPVSRIKTITLMYASWYYMANGNIWQAKRLFAMITIPSLEMSRLLYKSMLALLHLALLFEDRDERGLESIGLNYRRKLRQLLPVDSPVLAVIACLRNRTNLINSDSMKASFARLASDLLIQYNSSNVPRLLWHHPLINWLQNKAARQ